MSAGCKSGLQPANTFIQHSKLIFENEFNAALALAGK